MMSIGEWGLDVPDTYEYEGGPEMTEVFSELDQIDNLEDFEVYRDSLMGKDVFWKRRIGRLKRDKGYRTNREMAEACCVSVPTVRNWLAGTVPRSRESFIKIGFAEDFDVGGMNEFLQKYGYQALYFKNYEDAVYGFVLERKDELPEHDYHYCRKIIDSVRGHVELEGNALSVPTENLDERIGGMEAVPELAEFVVENAELFRSRYYGFYDYVRFFISENRLNEGSKDTINKLAEIQGWTSSLKQAIYDISNNCWFPTRNKVISIGLHLNMTVEELNHMLELAKMGPLDPRSPFESVIVFALRDAALNNRIHRDGSVELCISVRRLLERFGDVSSIDDFINDLPDEDE